MAALTKVGLHEDPSHRNPLVSLYFKCCLFGYVQKLLDEIPEPDLVSWSSLISGYAQNGLGKEALFVFYEMHCLGIKCNEFAFPSVLKTFSMTKDFVLGKEVQGIVVVTGSNLMSMLPILRITDYF
ncbi:hypothetical protein ACH5RR_016584 [Cinchona calisaya]|uniref:Pentatricopeptide repeat-containing protein n=1 Tax=Cinchona calisaya TaxID=153742 RepID=A0ABD2ZZI5_9GENT